MKANDLERYRDIVGDNTIEELYKLAAPLENKEVVHINSTLYGGGVAMILSSLVPLMNELNICTEWHQIKGETDFFVTTKMIHNALQGADLELSDQKKQVYLEIIQKNSIYTHFEDHDCVIVHDPQPLPLISCYKKRQPWIWRVHIDISRKNEMVWKFLQEFIHQYDHMIVSMSDYLQHLEIPQTTIMPSIDPFAYINQELNQSEIDHHLKKHSIEHDKPIIAQISRFDKWKDPLGVVKTFKKVRETIDCKLILLGNMAQDDPEGREIYTELITDVQEMRDVQVIVEESSFLVNALQREADVIIQKSVREGFGLTVSEALWKGTPVVASNVGGIPLQVVDGKTGYLVNNIDECAARITKLLKDPKLRNELGLQGKEYVKKNFLITRQLKDYINLLRIVMLHYKV
ncbi:MAG: glycosyltransferase [Candidatus Lokiarchaeota archaeon]|nr:glycosyltransferase [Candidatus Lokiarchaeota archaeon]